MHDRTGRARSLSAAARALAAGWAVEPFDDEGFPQRRLDQLRATPLWAGFGELAGTDHADELMDVLRLVGRADLSLGRLFEGHVNAHQIVTAYGSPAQRRSVDAAVAAGALLGVWATDPPDSLRVTEDGGLEGVKTFATGAGHLWRALATAWRPDGAKQLLLVPADDPARADLSGWRVRGMKGTESGRYDFTGLALADAEAIGTPGDYEREPRFSGGAWRFAAVQLGAAEALVRHLRDHLVAGPKGADPIQRRRFLDTLAGVRGAGPWVRRAAQATEAGSDDAVALTLTARGVVEDAALAAMEAAARSVGTASFATGTAIDRITRDLGLYLRQPVPDQARDRAAALWLERDRWGEDPWW